MIKPNKELAQLHDAYNKHAPAKVVCTVWWSNLAHKQWACSCGYVFYDGGRLGKVDLPVHNPSESWYRAVCRAYIDTGLLKEMKAHWDKIRNQKYD